MALIVTHLLTRHDPTRHDKGVWGNGGRGVVLMVSIECDDLAAYIERAYEETAT